MSVVLFQAGSLRQLMTCGAFAGGFCEGDSPDTFAFGASAMGRMVIALGSEVEVSQFSKDELEVSGLLIADSVCCARACHLVSVARFG